MAKKIDIELPPDLVIGDGWTIEWAAVDPNTGAAVSGVVVSAANVVANDSGGAGGGGGSAGPYMLVPGPGA